MSDHDPNSVEAILAKYRPAEAPPDLLCRVEGAALHRAGAGHEPCTTALSSGAELLLGFVVRSLLTAAAAIVLLLIASGGY